MASALEEEASTLSSALFSAGSASNESTKEKETQLMRLVSIYSQLKNADALASIVESAQPLLETMPKARTTKFIRSVMNSIEKIPNTLNIQENLCTECIQWAEQKKRMYLRQRLVARLSAIQLGLGKYKESSRSIEKLMIEVKKLDDKQLLVELHLIESKINHKIKNLPKAKAALTAARANAHAIYMTRDLQAQIDLQAGILQADSKDYKTAYSYFFEAFEAHAEMHRQNTTSSNKKKKKQSENASGELDMTEKILATQCLKYMLLTKVMMKKASDVESIVSGKVALEYEGRNVDCMRAVAKASKERSLTALEKTFTDFKEELMEDELIRGHLENLTETLLEENLERLIEPYSCVEIAHLAQMIKLPVVRVEHKLSQMILDQKLPGILDQGRGQLIIREVLPNNRSFTEGLAVVDNISKVVDSLFVRAKNLRI